MPSMMFCPLVHNALQSQHLLNNRDNKKLAVPSKQYHFQHKFVVEQQALEHKLVVVPEARSLFDMVEVEGFDKEVEGSVDMAAQHTYLD